VDQSSFIVVHRRSIVEVDQLPRQPEGELIALSAAGITPQCRNGRRDMFLGMKRVIRKQLIVAAVTGAALTASGLVAAMAGQVFHVAVELVWFIVATILMLMLLKVRPDLWR
jgi:hypothetical protein